MASGKYTRIDARRPSTNYCSTVTIVVFVALCLVGLWMMTSSSVIPGQNIDVPVQENKNEVKERVPESNESNSKQFVNNQGDLPYDMTKGDNNSNQSQEESDSATQENQEANSKQKSEVKQEEKNEENEPEVTKNIDSSNTVTQNEEKNTEDGDSKTPSGAASLEGKGNTADNRDSSVAGQGDSEEDKSDLDETTKEKKSDTVDTGTKLDMSSDGIKDEKIGNDESNEKKDIEDSELTKNLGGQANNPSSGEIFPSGAESEILNETTTQSGSWTTQAAESKNEKESQQSSNEQNAYNWKVCNVTAGPDYIPCLDNLQAIRNLRTTKHYEHRERHCPEEPPTCLVPLPEGYKHPIEWPRSREKIWYSNVPHTKLAEYKGHQNWVKVSGDYLTFPGGGTQFKHGALHYIDFINESVPDIAWGKRSRVILDVGCGVASFGGYLFDRDVLAMSFAPKDEHEAQVQFALERGIPAISAVMGTQRLPFPGRVFDIVHCARCRVPWHIEGGKLLLELNRVLRPGGFFVWSATPVYQKKAEDVEIWKAMTRLTKDMCWEVVSITKDRVNGVGIATYRKPTSNDCYEKRSQQEPPICETSDDPNAAWNVPLQACMHKVPVNSVERGSQWPEQWPVRLEKAPYWMLSSKVGVYGKPEPEDFTADYQHWKRVVSQSYLNGLGINWSSVRNVMDMRSIYGGFAAAMKDVNLWVMNVVPIDSQDTLPIIYERGLFGIYHDWCESFNTYPRSYDLLHADHLFSKVKKRCNLVPVVVEVDRILRPDGKLIVRDNVETVNEVEKILRSMQWQVHMTYSKDKEGLLYVEKSMWRPKESETVTYAIA
ncbi:probable methyltransferase PMT26 [Euphorbia lathyris]|uniref:probable methyltransferase PMT26 n=1 Tax=Euphorbia lathyris TaxID=212925 RepID=UPI00331449D5